MRRCRQPMEAIDAPFALYSLIPKVCARGPFNLMGFAVRRLVVGGGRDDNETT